MPKLKEVFAEAMMQPTIIHHEAVEVQEEAVAEESILIVSKNGELIENEDKGEGPGDENNPEPGN
jgi:hypothetical protein